MIFVAVFGWRFSKKKWFYRWGQYQIMNFHRLFEETVGKNLSVKENRKGVEPESVGCCRDILKSHGGFSIQKYVRYSNLFFSCS